MAQSDATNPTNAFDEDVTGQQGNTSQGVGVFTGGYYKLMACHSQHVVSASNLEPHRPNHLKYIVVYLSTMSGELNEGKQNLESNDVGFSDLEDFWASTFVDWTFHPSDVMQSLDSPRYDPS